MARLQPILELSGDNAQKLASLREVLSASETGLKGIEEMETIFGHVASLGLELPVELDLSLARGLNYYTGPSSRSRRSISPSARFAEAAATTT